MKEGFLVSEQILVITIQIMVEAGASEINVKLAQCSGSSASTSI